MATNPTVPFQFLTNGFAPAQQVQVDFDAFLKYITDRNSGTVAWDFFAVSGGITLLGAGAGVVFITPDNLHTYKLSVDNNGNLITQQLT